MRGKKREGNQHNGIRSTLIDEDFVVGIYHEERKHFYVHGYFRAFGKVPRNQHPPYTDGGLAPLVVRLGLHRPLPARRDHFVSKYAACREKFRSGGGGGNEVFLLGDTIWNGVLLPLLLR